MFAVDLRSLAALRIGLGLAVLVDVAVRALDLEGLYTDRGVFPRDLLLAFEGRAVYLSAHYWRARIPCCKRVSSLSRAPVRWPSCSDGRHVSERVRIIPRALPSPVTAVGTALRIQQTWNMFAPDPPTVTHRYEIARRLSDGTRVVEPASSSFRWTVYIGRVAGTHPPGHPLAESFRLFTERQCAWRGSGSVGAQLVDQVAVIAHRREISLDGLGEDQTRTLTAPSCF